jgi:hypothetical protein
MTFMGSDDPHYQVTNGQQQLNYYPTQNMYIPVNKEQVIREKMVPVTDTADIVSEVTFTMPKKVLYKNDLILLNVIAASNWERPIYFTSPVTATRMGLGSYLETDGLTYRLVPVASDKNTSTILSSGNVNLDFMYKNVMTEFKFGGAQVAGTYFDEPNRRMLLSLRNAYAKLGIALAQEGKKDSAIMALNFCDKNMLQENFPYALTSPGNSHNVNSLQTVYAYYLAGDSAKGDEIADEIINDCQQQMTYYNALPPGKLSSTLQQDAQTANMIISQLEEWQKQYGQHKGKASEIPARMDTLPSSPGDSGKK